MKKEAITISVPVVIEYDEDKEGTRDKAIKLALGRIHTGVSSRYGTDFGLCKAHLKEPEVGNVSLVVELSS